ncbi:MAG: hypothetical protein ACLRRB_09140 [Ruminococcus sp.]
MSPATDADGSTHDFWKACKLNCARFQSTTAPAAAFHLEKDQACTAALTSDVKGNGYRLRMDHSIRRRRLHEQRLRQMNV